MRPHPLPLSATTVAIAAIAGCSALGVNPPTLADYDAHPRNPLTVPACDLLTEEETRELGLGNEPMSMGDHECVWGGEEEVTVSVFPVATEGYSRDSPSSAVERIVNQNDLESFTETEIEGHPATQLPEEASGCGLEVAVSDRHLAHVRTSLFEGAGDPCDLVHDVAEAVIANSPPIDEGS